MRSGEVDGVNYFFITRDEFQTAVENGDFLEWAEFSGNCYGTRKSFILKSLEKGDNIILEIDTQGGLQVKKIMQEAVLIFIAPPSFEELENRLRGRQTEGEEVIQRRLAQANREKEASQYYDHIIVNDTIPNTVKQLENIIASYIN